MEYISRTLYSVDNTLVDLHQIHVSTASLFFLAEFKGSKCFPHRQCPPISDHGTNRDNTSNSYLDLNYFYLNGESPYCIK